MKKYILLLLTAFLTLGFYSCDDNAYSAGDFWISIASVEKDEDGIAQSFKLNDGKTLFVTSTDSKYKPKNERVIINYTILGNGSNGYTFNVKLNGYLQDILTKPSLYISEKDKEVQDSIGYDPINIISLSQGDRFLDTQTKVKLSGRVSHLINLVALSEDLKADADGVLNFELRHNINGDSENYWSDNQFVCFDMHDYIEANQELSEIILRVKSIDYNGRKIEQDVKFVMPK